MKQKLRRLDRQIDERTGTGSTTLNWLIAGLFLASVLPAFNAAGSTNLDNTVTSNNYKVTEPVRQVHTVDGYDFAFVDQEGRILEGKYVGLTNTRLNDVYLATNMTTGQTYATCTHELKHHKYDWVPHIRFDNPLGDGKIRLTEGWFDRPVYSDTCFKLLMKVDRERIYKN